MFWIGLAIGLVWGTVQGFILSALIVNQTNKQIRSQLKEKKSCEI